MAERRERLARIGDEFDTPGAERLGVEEVAEPPECFGGDLTNPDAAAHAGAALDNAPHQLEWSLLARGDLLDH